MVPQTKIYPMDNQKKDGAVSPEEAKLEQDALAEAKVEEIRASVITEFGFDEETDKDRIDKLVNKEIDNRKKLSSAIGQKIKYRTEAQELGKKVVAPAAQENKTVVPEELVRNTVDARLMETLEKRDLDAMPYPEDIKKEIQRIAKITGVSVIQAARDPYIVATKIAPWEKESGQDAAAISRTNRGGASKTISLDDIPEFDMTTPEGRKGWDDWKKKAVAAGR